jgi:hypothetical protein
VANGAQAVLRPEPFYDGQALLRVAEKHGLEGVVSKRREGSHAVHQARRDRGLIREASEWAITGRKLPRFVLPRMGLNATLARRQQG